jgi:hypothetical protein
MRSAKKPQFGAHLAADYGPKRYPERHRQLAAIRYYIRKALWDCQNRWHGVHHGITNHAALLDEIERWRIEKQERVCFVTFNYDTMLEEAMGRFLRLGVRDMDSYHTWENYSLFKLHGSLNWGRIVEGFKRESGTPSQSYQYLMNTTNPGNLALGRYLVCDF